MGCEDIIVRGMMMGEYERPSPEELLTFLGLHEEERAGIQASIEALRAAGIIRTLRGGKLELAYQPDLLQFGTIQFTATRGRVFFSPESVRPGHSTQLAVSPSQTGTALDGDRVLVRLQPPRRREPDYRPLAEVLFVFERRRTRFCGTLHRHGGTWIVEPDDPKAHVQFVVPDPMDGALSPPPKAGDCVAVELVRWDNPHMNPRGTIAANFGRAHTPLAEYRALIDRYELREAFPDAVLAEVSALPLKVSQEDCAGRLDLRSKHIFTIDPDTAKDFDDALGIEPLEGGGWRVGVHIADVAHYVRTGSALDAEALRRGNSTYLVGTVLPMLPHELSSGLCSLMEGGDRLTKSVFLEFDQAGKLQPRKTKIANSVIRSSKRLSYTQALALLNSDDDQAARSAAGPALSGTPHAGRPLSDLDPQELARLRGDIRSLWELAGRMRRERMFEGALDLDMPEVAIRLDAEGRAVALETVEYDESHQLVEEFMLAANEAVARALRRADIPCIFRVHDKPDEEKLQELAEYLRAMGLDAHDLSQRRELSRVMELIRAHPQSRILRTELLKSLKQACYRPVEPGHFGLCKTDYAHFTSPIRRYADLVVHRQTDVLLARQGDEAAIAAGRKLMQLEKLHEVSTQVSRTERISDEAERESMKQRLLEYLERESQQNPDASYEAVIMNIRRRGMFVELTGSLAYGMIPIAGMDDEYSFDEDRSMLRGRRGRSFLPGDTIRVRIANVDRAKRQIDFALADSPTPQRKKKGRAKKR